MKFTIECEMKKRWIPHFVGMLKIMQVLGGWGSSRVVGIFSDGDGDFRPKFKINGVDIYKVRGIKPPVYDDNEKDKRAVCDYYWDAG